MTGHRTNTEPVAVVDTRVANVASVIAALERAGVPSELTTDPLRIASARAVFLPGVGSFASGAATLDELRLREPLLDRITRDRPICAICLGWQLLCGGSEEGAGDGLGVVPVRVGRFPAGVRTPQLGWNAVRIERPPGQGGSASAFADQPDGYAYFANSFRVADVAAVRAAGFEVALAEHGATFVAAAARGCLLACQFHPELSGAWGQTLLDNWLRLAGYAVRRVSEVPGPPARVDAGLTRRVIPCLDVRDGRVVKGVRFQGLRDAGDPVEQALAYQHQGADELVMLDVSATTEGRATAIETVAAVRSVLTLPLTVGGGVSSVERAGALLDAGADKVSTNTAAVYDPALINRLADRFGSQCTVLAIDAARRERTTGWQVVVKSGTERMERDVVAWAREAVERGAGEILLTSWDRDGTKAGYDTELLRAVSSAVGDVPVIASGGASGPAHLIEALDAGADAVLAASIFHDGETTVSSVKRAVASSSAHPIRPPSAEHTRERTESQETVA